MPADGPSSPPPPLGGDLITPKDLHAITEAQEMARRKEAEELEKNRQEEQNAIHDAFMHQHIRPDARQPHGFAREVYDNYDLYLRPAGYKLRARILSYPGGMPGDVGIFLHW